MYCVIAEFCCGQNQVVDVVFLINKYCYCLTCLSSSQCKPVPVRPWRPKGFKTVAIILNKGRTSNGRFYCDWHSYQKQKAEHLLCVIRRTNRGDILHWEVNENVFIFFCFCFCLCRPRSREIKFSGSVFACLLIYLFVCFFVVFFSCFFLVFLFVYLLVSWFSFFF